MKGEQQYALIRLGIIMATLVTTLWLTASKFDGTEIRTIVVVFLAAVSVEGAGVFLRRASNGN